MMQRSQSSASTLQQSSSQRCESTTRYPAAHSTSSAFSASANADEDWTKISDLAERRRIQNRIAQRNYRKKLKRRLEDLERKAGSTSTSTSPEPLFAELESITSTVEGSTHSSTISMARQPSTASIASSTASQELQLSPDCLPFDDPFINMTQDQQFQHFSPPSYQLSSCSLGDDYFSGDFSFGNIQPVPQFYSEHELQSEYIHRLPPTLPSMKSDTYKQDQYSVEDDFLNPFGINYATLVGMEDPTHHVLSDCNLGAYPPDVWSPCNSRESTPSYNAQPSTPISRSTSPNVWLFEQSWQL